MPPKRRQAEDTSDAEPQYAKKSKGNTGKAQPQELTKGSDQDGNTFWELGSNRRISSSVFRNTTLINIREYYNADGKLMPGKKGISLSLAQYQALLKVIPQLNADLRKQGHAIEDPEFAEVTEQTDAPVSLPRSRRWSPRRRTTRRRRSRASPTLTLPATKRKVPRMRTTTSRANRSAKRNIFGRRKSGKYGYEINPLLPTDCLSLQARCGCHLLYVC
ncbi:unnamed protein product [Sordaria macrospora k-hell]|uniref:WGS project CABT00000000 data, contig 2.11 n=1 Tax=Sordaria macrospora (strain ATCC MYA-333 / DSM 997 / K(L3346) / K-hell) TaxID=771870 RepID=F7VXD3_SORMK|nr:uncharacterized protein SMAC_02752 [Sordaria macrospora k-hell]CCC10175.1 unnamed protein product [Sordaria macrospora k-hell]